MNLCIFNHVIVTPLLMVAFYYTLDISFHSLTKSSLSTFYLSLLSSLVRTPPYILLPVTAWCFPLLELVASYSQTLAFHMKSLRKSNCTTSLWGTFRSKIHPTLEIYSFIYQNSFFLPWCPLQLEQAPISHWLYTWRHIKYAVSPYFHCFPSLHTHLTLHIYYFHCFTYRHPIPKVVTPHFYCLPSLHRHMRLPL